MIIINFGRFYFLIDCRSQENATGNILRNIN